MACTCFYWSQCCCYMCGYSVQTEESNLIQGVIECEAGPQDFSGLSREVWLVNSIPQHISDHIDAVYKGWIKLPHIALRNPSPLCKICNAVNAGQGTRLLPDMLWVGDIHSSGLNQLILHHLDLGILHVAMHTVDQSLWKPSSALSPWSPMLVLHRKATYLEGIGEFVTLLLHGEAPFVQSLLYFSTESPLEDISLQCLQTWKHEIWEGRSTAHQSGSQDQCFVESHDDGSVGWSACRPAGSLYFYVLSLPIGTVTKGW